MSRGSGDDAERRERLRSLLEVASRRHAQITARRDRRPVMASGVRVSVVSGARARSRGVILDADYMQGRALIRFDTDACPEWIDFREIAAIREDEPGH